MCGTLKRSRTIVTPARGTGSTVPGPSSPSPKCADLNLLIRSASVTWSNSGVSASYISACSSAPAGGGHAAVLAGRDDVARGGGVVLSGGRGRGQHERRRGERGDPGHGAARYRRRVLATLLASAALTITPDVEAARELRGRAARHRRVRRPHRDALLGLGRRPRLPVRERAQGDAARRLRPRRARPPAARRRARAARADDPALGQPRRQRRSSPASARRASTASRARRA